MQQPDTPLTRIERQLERLEERTRDLATRQDLAELRKEVVTRDLLEAQLSGIRSQIIQIEKDRLEDKEACERRFKKMEDEQTTRSDRLWIKLNPAIAGLAFLLGLLEFLSHIHFVP